MQTIQVKRVGVIGGGQLAWMMTAPAKSLGIELIVQTPNSTDPAVALANDTILAAIDDASATSELANRCDVITFENEFIDLEALAPLKQQGVCFYPQLQALSPLLDKYDQRRYLNSLNLPVPRFFAFDKQDSNFSPYALTQLKFPIVIKARRHGYDGQGTFIIKDINAFESTLKRLAQTPILIEEFVPFERELAVIAARSIKGEIVTYPVVETQQENQVCRRVIVPAPIDSAVQAQVEAIAHTLLDNLKVVGLFGIELFLTAQGKVLVNEIAPRTHNSGHFTIDACETSQFEMHLRAVSGMFLGNPKLRCASAVMVNLLGFEHSHSDYSDKRQKLAALPQSFVHWYGKTESRPGRKLGHVTVLLQTSARAEIEAIAAEIESIWYNDAG